MSKATASPVAIYCRVSTAEQEKRGTIGGQRKILDAHAKALGRPVFATYSDDGKSATSGADKLAARGEWHRLKADMARGAFGAILVVNLDRLVRMGDLEERAAVLGPIRRAHVEIVTPSGTIDLNTYDGDLIAGITAAGAANEARTILKRTQGGKARLLDQGGKPHGQPPYGLRYVSARHSNLLGRPVGWTVDAAEHAIISEIFRRVIGGESCRVIALDLHARKVPAPRKIWQSTSVWAIVRLASTRYAGRWRANKVTGAWVEVPRLVSDDQIARADAALAAAGAQRRGLVKQSKRAYLIDQKFATCGECGGTIGIASGRQLHHRYYTCRGRENGRGYDGTCTARRWRTDAIDALIWDRILAELAAPNMRAKVAAAMAARDGGRDHVAAQRALELARKRIADADKKAAAIAGRVDVFSADLLAAALDRIAAERKAAGAELRAAEEAAARSSTPVSTPAEVAGFVAALRTRAATASPEERRTLARLLLGDVVLTAEGAAFTIVVPVGATPAGLDGDGVASAFTDCSSREYGCYHLARATVRPAAA